MNSNTKRTLRFNGCMNNLISKKNEAKLFPNQYPN